MILMSSVASANSLREKFRNATGTRRIKRRRKSTIGMIARSGEFQPRQKAGFFFIVVVCSRAGRQPAIHRRGEYSLLRSQACDPAAQRFLDVCQAAYDS